MEIMWVSFHGGGKYRIRRIMLNTLMRRDMTTLWKMLQGPMWNAVWAWCLAKLENPDGILNHSRVG